MRFIHYRLPISDHVYSVINQKISEGSVSCRMKTKTLLYFSPTDQCGGCLQAVVSSIHSTSISADIFFPNKIWIYESWQARCWKFICSGEAVSLSLTPSLISATENQPLLFLWLILFIFCCMHGHFKVRTMSFDPLTFLLLHVCFIGDGGLQSYVSLMKLQLNGCNLNRLSIGFRLKKSFPTHRI